MGAEPLQDWHKTLASALEWWRDAGVDMLVEDEARDWTARPAPRPESVAAAPASAVPQPQAPEALPDTLEAFVAWRMSDAAPEAQWMTSRVPSAGPADAEWTVLVDMPEAEDSDTLMSGPAGRLLDRMLLAVGLSRANVHLASLAVARPVTGQIGADEGPRLVELARHHLSLVKPKKLLLLGQAASRAVPETGGSFTGKTLIVVNHFGPDCAVVATHHPRFLLERPAFKSEAWRHLLLLHRGDTV
ncbi:MAG: uracil-DNA glycosylase [Sphingomonas sp.]|uniref:uracil-DNA glycosylase family protein n=1 Tax=Sphingomonas sp. TaxID=28214 RepID=UPI001B215EE1|nr:uracil-DNA glycosylase family protein [Sphingomonas sp.]MBO9623272.1 uracil-DNA glycosylase [Sphingomonas sp.]